MANGLTEEVIEQVAEHLEETAVVTRAVSAKSVGIILVAVGVGVGVGFYFGTRYNQEKIYKEAHDQSERELEQIREAYRRKEDAASKKEEEKEEEPLPLSTEKPALEDLIEQKEVIQKQNYSDIDQTDIDLSDRPLKPPVPIDATKRVFRTEEGEKDKDMGWDYTLELRRRTGNHPFIIHQDEYAQNESGYNQVSYTYYAGDDVLADEDDSELTQDEIVGVNNLTKFGHGTDDINLLYIRNPVLELEMEISRSEGSYEEEVEGLSHSDEPSFEPMPRHRRRFDDDETS